MSRNRGILLIALAAALPVCAAVEVDFSGGAPEGWTVEGGEYRSPDYGAAVDRISLRYSSASALGAATVYASSSNQIESQIAAFTAASSAAAFDFPDTTDFRSFRISTANGLTLTSFVVNMVAALNACPISSLEESRYAQNFDLLALAGTNWLNCTTLPYWQAYRNVVAATSIKYNGGAGAVGGLYALAEKQSQSQRALGALSTQNDEFSFGIAFANDTDKAVALSTVEYSSQQWGFNNSTNQTLSLSARVSGGLDWISAYGDGWVTLAETQSAVYGKETAHDTPVAIPVSVNSAARVIVEPGQILMLRWRVHKLKSGKSGIMGIDDVVVTFAKAPQSYGFSLRIVNNVSRP